MQTLDPETFENKYNITEAAVECYVEQGGSFSFKDIARKTGYSVGELFNYFPDKRSILEFYYTSLVIRYRLMIEEIEDFDQYSLSEKLSNFVFSSFDLMDERLEFVEASFKPVIECALHKTEFENEIEQLLRRFFEEDDMIGSANRWILNAWFYSLLRRQYLCTVGFWLNDTSEGKEQTMVFVDKTTALLQEVLYNAVLDRSLDLAKFLATNKFFIDQIPFVKRILSNIEIRE